MAPVAGDAMIAFGFGFGALVAGTLCLVEGPGLAIRAPDFVAKARLTDAHVPDEDIAGQPRLSSSIKVKEARRDGLPCKCHAAGTPIPFLARICISSAVRLWPRGDAPHVF